jgi:hypothetical protein
VGQGVGQGASSDDTARAMDTACGAQIR